MSSLALLYAFGGLSAAGGSVVEVLQGGRANPVAVIAGPVVVVMSLAIRRWRRHEHPVVLHALMVLAIAVVFSMIAVTRRPEGAMTTAGVLACIAMIAAWSFSLPVARAYAALMCVALATAMSVAGHPRMQVAVASVCVVVIAITEVQARLVAKLRTAVLTDHLTGVLNRRGVIAVLETEMALTRRTLRNLHVAVIDLDGFKTVNDTQGHAAGDDLLCELTRSWLPVLRERDHLARLGGDEFLLVMPDSSDLGALQMVERLRRAHDTRWTCGIARLEPDHGPSELIALADERLISAKNVLRSRPGAVPRSRRSPVRQRGYETPEPAPVPTS